MKGVIKSVQIAMSALSIPIHSNTPHVSLPTFGTAIGDISVGQVKLTGPARGNGSGCRLSLAELCACLTCFKQK